MNPEQDSTPDHFQQIWQAETAWPQVTINTDSLREEVRGAQGRFRHIINCRDAREIGIGLVMLPVWLVMGIRQSQPWTWYLTIPAILFVISFMLIDRWRHPQKPSEPGEPLLFYVRESLAQVEHQIWLLRNVFWWYLLPFSLSIMAYFIQTGWQTASNLWGFLAQVGFSGAFLWLVYWGIWKLNQIAVRNQLEPRRQTLQKLIDSLESDQPGEDSTDLFDLVSSLDQPQSGARLNYDWVGSWNRLVPSWTISLGIILATLGGALLGAFFPIPGMGPVLFQSIVAAVLCNEFALILAWLRIRKSKEQTSKDDSEMTTLCNASGHFRSQLKQVRTPAFLILCLAYLMGILAFVALCAFFFTDSDAALVQRGPGLENISQWTEEDIAHLDSWLQRFVGEDDFYPSLSAAIVRDGELIYSRSFGYADQESKTLATPQTRFHVASVTKVFTATLAAILAERGVVDLDQPVLQYLPKGISISTTPEIGAKITLSQLASHTSGLPRGVPGKVQSVEGWYELEPELLYKQLATIKLESEPGTAELYSNLGFGLLGHALERAANQPLHKLVDELICKPLQLERTAIQHDDSLDVATGYLRLSNGGSRIQHSYQERLAGSGGLVTTVEDLAKFLAAQMKPGTFSGEVLEQLHKKTLLRDETSARTALGWKVDWTADVGHYLKKNGGRNNCSAWIGFSPEDKIGVAIVTNCGGPAVDPLGYKILSQIIPHTERPLVSENEYGKVAPFTGVRWEKELPVVQVEGEWYKLSSINGIAINRILQFAEQEFGSKARKRFAEDLVEVLTKMGHEPKRNVILGLESFEGEFEFRFIKMTEENRKQVWDQGNP